MNKIAILYGSTTGNTEAVAKKISSLLNADLFNVADGPAEIHEKYEAVVFFSPSGVRSFAKFNSLENLKIFSIGQTTEKELRKFTQNKIFTSKESNLEDLLTIIKQNAHS